MKESSARLEAMKKEMEEQVVVTELNMSRVSAIREQLPILSARRTDVYGVRKK